MQQQSRINGIVEVKRDTAFDNKDFLSAGIRLLYETTTDTWFRVSREGVLLEVGFDDVTPNTPKDISSWAYDYAADSVEIIDNRAKRRSRATIHATPSSRKLQTVSTKFRQQQEDDELPIDFMRHYYDVYSLLQRPEVQAFIGTDAYKAHKAKRFRQGDNPNIAANQAFILTDPPDASSTKKPTRKPARSTTRTSQALVKFWKRLVNGSISCEGAPDLAIGSATIPIIMLFKHSCIVEKNEC